MIVIVQDRDEFEHEFEETLGPKPVLSTLYMVKVKGCIILAKVIS